MFTNVRQVKEITGKDVTNDHIIRAQYVIETFVGKNESEVSDADDVAIMAKAVAYQTVYMMDNYDRVFEQAAIKQYGQLDSQMTLDTDMGSPFVAPLAVYSLRSLSWRRSRSVRTGRIFTGAGDPWGRWENT